MNKAAVKAPICPYCNTEAVLQKDTVVYQSGFGRLVWVCKNYPTCSAYVGVHRNSTIPLGSLANEEVRSARKAAHRIFDWIWQSDLMHRKRAYAWLGDQMKLKPEDCHIGMMSVEQCNQVIELSNAYLNANLND